VVEVVVVGMEISRGGAMVPTSNSTSSLSRTCTGEGEMTEKKEEVGWG
jgi:hypothetical protein